jgi:hypothetical protein
MEIEDHAKVRKNAQYVDFNTVCLCASSLKEEKKIPKDAISTKGRTPGRFQAAYASFMDRTGWVLRAASQFRGFASEIWARVVAVRYFFLGNDLHLEQNQLKTGAIILARCLFFSN